MRRLPISRPVLFGALAAVVVLGLWYEVLWSPQSNSLTASRRRAQDANTAYIVASQRLGHLKRDAKGADGLNQLAARLNGAIPNTDDLDGLITTLNGDAQHAGVGLTALSVVQPGGVAKTTAGTIPLQLSVTGGYFAIHRFLDAMRDGARLIVVDAVTLSGGSTAPGANSSDGTPLSASITARSFISTGIVTTVPTTVPVPPSGAKVGKGTGTLEVPINQARSAAAAASQAANTAGTTP